MIPWSHDEPGIERLEKDSSRQPAAVRTLQFCPDLKTRPLQIKLPRQ
jgi:hypothetical protein